MATSLSTTFISNLEDFIKDTLSPARYIHSQGVAQLAEKLAKRFDVEHDLALVAGWGHDCTREWEQDEQRLQMEKCDRLTAEMVSFPMVWHGYTAAGHLQKKLGFYDKEVDLAMQRHSIGNLIMSDLDKILFVSDYLEANRPYLTPLHQGILLNASLDTLFTISLAESVDYIKTAGQTVHPTSLQLLTKYKEFL